MVVIAREKPEIIHEGMIGFYEDNFSNLHTRLSNLMTHFQFGQIDWNSLTPFL